VREIYGSGGYDGGDHGDHAGDGRSDNSDPWKDGDPDGGLNRIEERERAKAAWDHQRGGYGDDQADDGWDQDPDAENYADLRYLNDATIEAGLDEADLPARAESRAATWGPDATDEADEDDACTEDDRKIEALLAGQEEGLPTRAESRAATWGDHSVFDDGTDPDADDDDGRAVRDEPALDQAPAWTLTPHATGSAARGDYPYLAGPYPRLADPL
jgi:hypothetical protein